MLIVGAGLRSAKESLVGNLVHAAVAERITPKDPPSSKDQATEYAQLLNRLD